MDRLAQKRLRVGRLPKRLQFFEIGVEWMLCGNDLLSLLFVPNRERAEFRHVHNQLAVRRSVVDCDLLLEQLESIHVEPSIRNEKVIGYGSIQSRDTTPVFQKENRLSGSAVKNCEILLEGILGQGVQEFLLVGIDRERLLEQIDLDFLFL